MGERTLAGCDERDRREDREAEREEQDEHGPDDEIGYGKTRERTVETMRSIQLPGRTPAATPSRSESGTSTAMVTSASTKVFRTGAATIAVTGVLLV